MRFDTPTVAYREKITKTVDVEGKHKKQNGGSGQYGHVKMKFGPGEGDGLTFTVSVVGGTVPKNFYPAVEKGIQDSMVKGAYGYPMVALAADLYDGSYHAVDSDELSFKTAASLAYKKALEMAGPVLLEPTELRQARFIRATSTPTRRLTTTLCAEMPKPRCTPKPQRSLRNGSHFCATRARRLLFVR